MPVYLIDHASPMGCGFHGEQFLQADKENVQTSCPRCLRRVIARQERKQGQLFGERDDVIGVMQRNGSEA